MEKVSGLDWTKSININTYRTSLKQKKLSKVNKYFFEWGHQPPLTPNISFVNSC